MPQMNPRRSAFVLTFVTIAVLVASMVVRAQAPGVDPVAVETLKRMTDYVKNLQQFSVHTENTLEDLLDTGQRVDFSVSASVLVRRPDKIHARREGELFSQDFYFDGKSLTLYNPSDGMYATVPAPGTIEELLDYTRESLGLEIPVSDLMYRNAFAIMMQDVTSGIVVGKATIGGITCNHLAFSRPHVDFQVWVAEGDRPLPCKYVVTDTRAPELVSTVTVMSDWNLAPETTDASFKFVPPDGAKPITFMPIDETSKSGG